MVTVDPSLSVTLSPTLYPPISITFTLSLNLFNIFILSHSIEYYKLSTGLFALCECLPVDWVIYLPYGIIRALSLSNLAINLGSVGAAIVIALLML